MTAEIANMGVYASLQEQFEETKKNLKNVEDNIRRLTGREPDQFNVSGINKWQNVAAAFPGNSKSFLPKKRASSVFAKQEYEEMEEPAAVEEDSGDEDGVPSKKPSIQSSVVATQKDIKSRRDTIEEQKSDSRGMARNRRMFGMILGTLQKFQHEESRRKEQAQKRAEVEKKVEEAAEKEKEELKKEKQDLFVARREKQTQIRCLEKKMEIAKIHEKWVNKQKLLLNFIQTTSKPQVMFLPAKHNHESQKRLKESQEKIEAVIEVHKTRIEKELLEIDEWYRKDSMQDEESPGDKENRGPVDETDPQEAMSQEIQDEESVCATEVEPMVVEIEDRTGDKLLETLADQEFEPIYDE